MSPADDSVSSASKAKATETPADIDRLCIDTIRTLAMDAVQKAESGHPGTPMALAPVAYTLWQRFLRYDPADPTWPNRDRFVLSAGHASMLLYALLHLTGVRRLGEDGKPSDQPAVSLDDIKQFRQLDSVTPGHPEYGVTTGVEVTTGPLGQGCGNSVGMAMGQRWLAARYNTTETQLIDYNVYVICSDGDMEEGISSEAASIAGHLKLANLCWIYDSNTISIEGHTNLAFTENTAERFAGYGWNVLDVADANDCEAMAHAIEMFQKTDDRPTLIIVHSLIGYGSPDKQNTAKAHGEPLGVDEVRLTKRFYGWPEDAQFLVPAGVREHFDAGIGARGRKLNEDWQALHAHYQADEPAKADDLRRMFAHELPEGWDSDIPVFPADAKGLASRESGGKVLNAIAARLPWLLGGSADLSPSTKTNLTFDGAGAFEPDDHGGRNLHFGIREHAMGAITNGLNLSGPRAYGSTFFVFSDYMKPPIRLAALMELGSIFVFTHDSIGVGEDGPTHQPIEQLAMLRAMPGLMVLRPADANETAEAWRVILRQHKRPACLVLSRQALPTFDRQKYAPAAGVARGAYVLADAEGGEPEIILMASGSEVSLCAQAYEKLTAEGVKARVVSMPSWDLFEAQDKTYRESVFPAKVTARLAVEQAAALGWDRYVGPAGDIICMDRFGASAPFKDLKVKFGFTADRVYETAKHLLAKEQGRPMTNPLLKLSDAGQAVWLDFIERKILKDGTFQGLIDKDGLKGVTSNPSIFEKAIGESSDYDAPLKAFVEGTDGETAAVFEHLAIADIQAAADQLRPVYNRLDGRDGYVSLEVSPYLAMDTEGTIAEARRLWAAVDRPNLMVKVPGTGPGTPAIRQLISEGLNINVTLLFALEAYDAVAEAYLAGLEARKAAGGDISKIASVASFFVSRIDTQIDDAIDARLKAGAGADEEALKKVRGQVAIANAKIAYQHYLDLLQTPRWKALAAAGAQPQRLLWASTGTKNPDYSDVLYIETLIGADTVNTMPPKTMDAFRDHGAVRPSLTEDVEGARAVLASAEKLGLDLKGVTTRLVEDGVKQFADAADKLYGAVAGKRATVLGAKLNGQSINLSEDLKAPVKQAADKARTEGWPRRLWAHDAGLWTGKDEAKWLGWLPAANGEQVDLQALRAFQAEVKDAGFIHALLLGMGGSSLGPEVLAETFGTQPGHPKLLVLDSTDPAQIARFEAQIDPARTLFIVSSKSGTTLEPDILHRYFMEKVEAVVGVGKGGANFVAVTDPGSKLEATAKAQGFRHVFLGDPEIGGRYSVLSNFGMVPAAAAGIDVGAFLDSAKLMTRACGANTPPAANPGVELGLVMGAAALAGRDKLTLIASHGLADVGAWLEQLVAESTGKIGKGIIPLAGEPLGGPEVYGTDRLFAYLSLTDYDDSVQDAQVRALEAAGYPVVRITLADRGALGQEFVRWEVATAIAGAMIGIDPFDQPDVEASKIKTRALTADYEKNGAQTPEKPILEAGGLALHADPKTAEALAKAASAPTVEAYLTAHFASAKAGDYVGLLAYVDRDHRHVDLMNKLRQRLRDHTKCATVVGFGPRFLHSTGQAYKGGPNSGVFLEITHDAAHDLAVPGQKYSFSVVELATAQGDLEVLVERGRRALRVHLGADVEAGLSALAEAISRALS